MPQRRVNDFDEDDDVRAARALGDEVAAAAAETDRRSNGTARCSIKTCTRAAAPRVELDDRRLPGREAFWGWCDVGAAEHEW